MNAITDSAERKTIKVLQEDAFLLNAFGIDCKPLALVCLFY
jgi:hypothetical protein